MSGEAQPTNYGPMQGGPETYGVRIQMLEIHLRDTANMVNQLVRAMADRRVDEMELRGQIAAAVAASNRTASIADNLSSKLDEQREDLRGQIDDWRREQNGRIGRTEGQIKELQGLTKNMVCIAHVEEFADNRRRLSALEDQVSNDEDGGHKRKLVKAVKTAGISVGGIGGIWVILEWIWTAFGKHAAKAPDVVEKVIK